MRNTALLIVLAVMFMFTAMAQEDTDPVAEEAAPADVTETVEEEDEAEEPVVDDDEYYQDVDDEDFRPSEDIPADQSIPFPADI
jgi:hypothetical protein